MQAACGSSVEASIKWDDASDEHLSEHSNMASQCSIGIDAISNACTRYPEAKEKVKKAGQVLCRIDNVPGGNPGFRFAEGAIEYRGFGESSSRMIFVAAREFLDEKEILLQYKKQLVLIGKPSDRERDSRPIFAGSAATGMIQQAAKTGYRQGLVVMITLYGRLHTVPILRETLRRIVGP